jgi:threonine dehydrogenase-like Zn-dependent dehydrogenase
MTDKLNAYRHGGSSLPAHNTLWPLYGAGLENLGKHGQPLDVPFPAYGPDELLVRHDACGLCFSDTKVIAQGQNHPRILRNMQKEPVVLGHEVSMTVVGVGKNLHDHYAVGDRLTLETDIITNGKNLAYGYWFQGGLSQYNVIGPEIYASDLGNNLISVSPDKGYAEIALTEPWACVVAAYALKYRTSLKEGGVTWIIGVGGVEQYSVSTGFDTKSHPSRLLLTDVPQTFSSWLRERAAELGVEVTEVQSIESCPVEFVDDIVLLEPNAESIEQVSPRLAQFGVMAVLKSKPLERPINVDVGRIHYNRWAYVGTTKKDVALAHKDPPIRSNIKPGGRTWFVGAGGPMGRMHLQRALEFNNPPAVILCTDVNNIRLAELNEVFSEQARQRGIQIICLNPMDKVAYAAGMTAFQENGFDDIIVLAPIPAVIAEASRYLALRGVLNIFTGISRGSLTAIDLSAVYLQGNRYIGHSGSLMSDFELVLEKTNSGELSPNRSVAAVGSLSSARDGLKAVKDTTLTGKVVIYPNIKELPLTTLEELKERLPTVYNLLNERGEWTNAAEEEFLRLMLP